MLISAQEISIRAVTEKDAELLLRNPLSYANTYNLHLPNNWPYHNLSAHLPLYHDLLQKERHNEGYGPWIISAEGNIVGDISIQSPPNKKGEIWIGYYICPGERLKGFATKAIKQLCNWALSQHKIKTIYAECIHTNKPSIHALRRAGFVWYDCYQDIEIYKLREDEK
ncbi:GNAT family N-acetyltransferase [Salinibacillus kushneri]|uniref:GNAT family N-acetyltransferase n=1 Tax=Salinibacillus kushneri TaxID=237682 RepID=UPI0015A636E0|nr:GNAT family N-acetyltransferase [Salinibacillus kushneri]